MADGHSDAPHAAADAHDNHGHAAEQQFEIIAEGSGQDKLLVSVAIVALLLLGCFAWSMTHAQVAEPVTKEHSGAR
jgi:hypothetical protein